MSRRVVGDLPDDFVPEFLVEGPRLKAVHAQMHTPAAVLPGFLFGGFEELLAVSPSSQRLGHPQEREVQPSSPDIAENAAEDRTPRPSRRKIATGL